MYHRLVSVLAYVVCLLASASFANELYAHEWRPDDAATAVARAAVVGSSVGRNGNNTGIRNSSNMLLPAPEPPLGYQPNFVFILTDDQDRILGREGYDSLGSLGVMPVLQKRLLGEGAVVENFMVNTPICCPSRTEFFTGRYFHNVGPPTVEGSCMHADTTRAGSNMTGLFGLMKRVGYNVGVFGKVTNDQTRILQQLGDDQSVDFIDAPVDYNDYEGMRYWQYWAQNRSTNMEKLSKTNPIFGTPYQVSSVDGLCRYCFCFSTFFPFFFTFFLLFFLPFCFCCSAAFECLTLPGTCTVYLPCPTTITSRQLKWATGHFAGLMQPSMRLLDWHHQMQRTRSNTRKRELPSTPPLRFLPTSGRTRHTSRPSPHPGMSTFLTTSMRRVRPTTTCHHQARLHMYAKIHR